MLFRSGTNGPYSCTIVYNTNSQVCGITSPFERRASTILSGRDFNPDVPLSVAAQVDKLIIQATSLENLCQCFSGWFVHASVVIFVDHTHVHLTLTVGVLSGDRIEKIFICISIVCTVSLNLVVLLLRYETCIFVSQDIMQPLVYIVSFEAPVPGPRSLHPED